MAFGLHERGKEKFTRQKDEALNKVREAIGSRSGAPGESMAEAAKHANRGVELEGKAKFFAEMARRASELVAQGIPQPTVEDYLEIIAELRNPEKAVEAVVAAQPPEAQKEAEIKKGRVSFISPAKGRIDLEMEGKTISLKAKRQYPIAALLYTREGQNVSSEVIGDVAYGDMPYTPIIAQKIRNDIMDIRRDFSAAGINAAIETVEGVGYRLILENIDTKTDDRRRSGRRQVTKTEEVVVPKQEIKRKGPVKEIPWQDVAAFSVQEEATLARKIVDANKDEMLKTFNVQFTQAIVVAADRTWQEFKDTVQNRPLEVKKYLKSELIKPDEACWLVEQKLISLGQDPKVALEKKFGNTQSRENSYIVAEVLRLMSLMGTEKRKQFINQLMHPCVVYVGSTNLLIQKRS